MLQFKRISINLALVVSLAALAGVNFAQAEKINIPLPTQDLEIQAVVDNVRTGVDVKAIMRQTRDNIKVEQVKRLPLLPQMRNAVGNVVSTRVMEETRTQTMNTQMAAMQDPVNPEAIPTFIAPKFE
ncbi:MAG: hypothetical protein D3903_12055 [Candidatus Electrothrix sp. GM3_4]|nr:hypothetical protein [Candidatus Electrothrix sp. GM3_4]